LKRFCVAVCLLAAVSAHSGTTPERKTLQIGTAAIHIEIDSHLRVPEPLIEEWVRRAAVAVTNYLGSYPVNTVEIRIHAGHGAPIGGGVTHGASRIDVRVGPDARAEDLRGDWVLTHEMFHLAFPTLKDRYLWMMEGLSDYLEPVARARVGQLTAGDVWREFVEGIPQGLPAADDPGLDNSSSRERIYWGGNLFWLLADVQIRVRTGDRRSVDDAIRAILKAGGNGGADWSIERVIHVGDKATGTQALKELYEELGLHRGDIHLDSLWQSLGVVYRHGAARFDDSAPWAAVRGSITARTGR
jgi:predicted metalloprotease with PDZ domain